MIGRQSTWKQHLSHQSAKLLNSLRPRSCCGQAMLEPGSGRAALCWSPAHVQAGSGIPRLTRCGKSRNWLRHKLLSGDLQYTTPVLVGHWRKLQPAFTQQTNSEVGEKGTPLYKAQRLSSIGIRKTKSLIPPEPLFIRFNTRLTSNREILQKP